MKKLALALAVFGLAPLTLCACDTETATTAVIDNAYPAVPDGGDATKELTVYKVWYVTTLFLDPVAPGAESAPAQRTVPANDYAYALVAPGWDPSSTTPPTALIPMKSAAPLVVNRGDTLHITVSDDSFVGNCAAGKALSPIDADFITENIFPGDFAGVRFDAATCTATPIGDGGAPAADAARE